MREKTKVKIQLSLYIRFDSMQIVNLKQLRYQPVRFHHLKVNLVSRNSWKFEKKHLSRPGETTQRLKFHQIYTVI